MESVGQHVSRKNEKSEEVITEMQLSSPADPFLKNIDESMWEE